MAVGFKVKHYWYQIGNGDFLHSFFSTICYNLEGNIWGSKYPHIMNELYSGELKNEDIKYALNELEEIKKELYFISKDKVIWDINNLSKQPPWGNNVSKDITSLRDYFVTSDGDDLITVLNNALIKAMNLNADVLVESI